MCWLSLCQYYFGVVMAESIWILIDVFINIGLSSVVVLSGPAEKLAPRRPSAQLFGPWNTLASGFQVLNNLLFLCIGFGALYGEPFFKCLEYDASSIDSAKWWLKADNYEAETIGVITMYQFVNSAAVVNLGGDFRAPWIKNYSLILLWLIYLGGVSYLLFANVTWLTSVMRMNTGDESWLLKNGYEDQLAVHPWSDFGFFGMEAATLPVSCGTGMGTMENLRACLPSDLPWQNMYTYNNIYPQRFKYELALIAFFNFLFAFGMEYFLQNGGRLWYRSQKGCELKQGRLAVQTWANGAEKAFMDGKRKPQSQPVKTPPSGTQGTEMTTPSSNPAPTKPAPPAPAPTKPEAQATPPTEKTAASS